MLGHQVTARTCLSYDSATCHVASPIFYIKGRKLELGLRINFFYIVGVDIIIINLFIR